MLHWRMGAEQPYISPMLLHPCFVGAFDVYLQIGHAVVAQFIRVALTHRCLSASAAGCHNNK